MESNINTANKKDANIIYGDLIVLATSYGGRAKYGQKDL
jgi:hypothetical protein